MTTTAFIEQQEQQQQEQQQQCFVDAAIVSQDSTMKEDNAYESNENSTNYYNDYGYVPTTPRRYGTTSNSSFTPTPSSARKQRMPSCRRGGACHSDLLKSAVLATLDGYVESDDEGLKQRSTSMASSTCASEDTNITNATSPACLPLAVATTSSSMSTISSNGMDDHSRSSRKRARQPWHDYNDEYYHSYSSSNGSGAGADAGYQYDQEMETIRIRGDAAMEIHGNYNNSNNISLKSPPQQEQQQQLRRPQQLLLDDCLLGAMDFCSISTTRASTPPMVAVRHVSRRTSKELPNGMVPSPRRTSTTTATSTATTVTPGGY